MQLQSVNKLASRPITWFWPGRFALGKLAMLDGDPGLGKSLLALDLCARLSTGRPFPDDQPGTGICNRIVLNAEDSAQDTTRPRLQGLGANLERVFVPFQGNRGDAELFLLASGIPQLDFALKRTHARLVVFDPYPGCAARPWAGEYNPFGVKKGQYCFGIGSCFTPKGLYSPAQGRAANPGLIRRREDLLYPEGVVFPSPGSRRAPWVDTTASAPWVTT